MAKGNLIVGLAHVVVSQQEMLEKANEQIEELQNSIKSKQDDADNLDKYLKGSNILIKKLKQELQNAKEQEDYFSGEYNRINAAFIDLQKTQAYEHGSIFHWQKFQPDADGRMCIPLGHNHARPIVDGFYRYTEEHSVNFYDEVTHQSVPVKNCYGIGCVYTTIIDGKLYIYSSSEKGAELIGFSVRYIDDYIIMDELPEELKEE